MNNTLPQAMTAIKKIGLMEEFVETVEADAVYITHTNMIQTYSCTFRLPYRFGAFHEASVFAVTSCGTTPKEVSAYASFMVKSNMMLNELLALRGKETNF